MVGKLGTRVQFNSERVDLFLSGYFTGEKQPQNRFQHGFAIASDARVSGEDGLAFGDGESTESDTLIRIQVGSFPEHALDSTGTSDQLVNSDFSNFLVSMFLFQESQGFLLFRELSQKSLLKSGHRASGLCNRDL